MSHGNKIIKTEVTESWIRITLENGVEIGISSNNDSFNFSFSGVELPLSWGYHNGPTGIIGISNNTINCFYKPKSYD